MSYLVGQLILDVLPRLSKMKAQPGISIYQAATSIQSLIYKRLLERHSDLQASADLDLNIAAGGYSAALPAGFITVAEKPKAQQLYTNWMAGSVSTYNSVTGALVANITTASGTDTLADWDLALAATPGVPSSIIGSSVTSLTVGTGVKNLTVDTGLTLTAGQAIYIITADLPATINSAKRKLQPSYLGDDDMEHDASWWADYQYDWYGEEPGLYPSRYKVVGTTMYFRPTVIMNVKVTGRYFARPAQLTGPSSPILWDSLFDEVFREGVVRIVSSGMPAPEANGDFNLYLQREVDTVLNSRIKLMPDTGRLKRGNFL